MQHDLLVLQKWMIINLLTLNVRKTQYMLFGRARALDGFEIQLVGNCIERVFVFKYLGLYLDPYLKFDKHIDNMRRKIGPFTGLMWRCHKYLLGVNKKKLYFSYVFSHLTYMMAVWGVNLQKTRIQQLRVVQNKAIKSIFGLPRLTSTTFLYGASILPVELLIPYSQMLRIYKMKNNLVKHEYQLNTNLSQGIRSTRQSNMLFVPKTECLLADSIINFNLLDSRIVELSSIVKFKLETRIFLMENSEEFHIISPFVNINKTLFIIIICFFSEYE